MRTLLTVLLLAVNVVGQPWLYGGPVERRSWPGTGNITGATAGLFAGYGYPDVVILRGGQPHMYASPALLNALVTSPIAGAPLLCTALTTLYQDRAPNGRRRDSLVVSHLGGLSAWGMAGGVMQWVVLDTRTEWAALSKLITTDLNGDGFEDLVALSGDRRVVRARLSDNGALGTGPGFEFALPVATDVLDVTTTAWDGDPEREIAVATAAGVDVHEYDFSTSVAVPGTGAPRAWLASVRRPGGELLVQCMRDDGDLWTLNLLDPLNPGSVTLGAIGVVACVAGDADADGDDDLILGQNYAHRALLLVQRPGYGFSYTPADSLELPLIAASATPALSNKATPVLADLDGDGDADLVHPVQSDMSMTVVRSYAIAGPTIGFEPLVGNQDYNMTEGGFEFTRMGTPRTDALMHFKFDLAPGFPATATHIEAVVWREEIHPLTGAISDHQPHSTKTIPANAASLVLAFNVDVEVHLENGGLLLLQLRPIRVVGTEIERTFGPSTYLIAGAEYSSPALPVLLNLPQVISETGLRHQRYGMPPIHGGDTNGGIGSGSGVGVEPPPPPDPPPGGEPPPGGG